jgi:hypothetical protein
LCCDFFYKKHKVRLSLNGDGTPVESSNVGVIPVNTAITVNSLYELIIRQGKEIEGLKKDVAKLKTNQSARVNRSVKAELAEETPTVNFTDWAKTVEVRLEHLEEVFKYTKVDGVKRCVKDAIERCEGANRPIRSSSQKISSIYVYDLIPTPKKSPDVAESERKYGWVRMTTEHVHSLVAIITRGLMLKHFEYQTENKDRIESDEKEQEKMFLCIKKLNNMVVPLEKQKAEIKKWLISYIISV